MDDYRISGHDAAELQVFFKEHAAWLFGRACVLTRGDKALAEDLVQDTFEAAARIWSTELRDRLIGSQQAWLLTTARNKEISAFRRREAFRAREPELRALYLSAEADTPAQALAAAALEQAALVIRCLPERQHQIALMCWQDGMKATEIAAELGIAIGTVYAQVHAIRQKLIGELGPYYPFGKDAKGEAS